MNKTRGKLEKGGFYFKISCFLGLCLISLVLVGVVSAIVDHDFFYRFTLSSTWIGFACGAGVFIFILFFRQKVRSHLFDEEQKNDGDEQK